jgi:hypothetical protein
MHVYLCVFVYTSAPSKLAKLVEEMSKEKLVLSASERKCRSLKRLLSAEVRPFKSINQSILNLNLQIMTTSGGLQGRVQKY